MSNNGFSLRERADRAYKAAQDIFDAAGVTRADDLSPQQQNEARKHLQEHDRLSKLSKSADEAQANFMKYAGIPDDQATDMNGNPVVGSGIAKGNVLALTGTGSKDFARIVASKAIAEHGTIQGAKAIVGSGATVTDVPVVSSHQLGTQPVNLLRLLNFVKRETPSYRYLRQVTRTNSAAIVAPGATKPTSTYTIAPYDGKVEVFAHLSEPIDKYLLQDMDGLERFIQIEMLIGLNAALEQEVLNGDGTTGHLRGILNTSGIQTVAPTTGDDLTALRSAITQIENAGYVTSAFVLNPLDWQALETARNTSGAFDLEGPIDRARPRIWGVPVVTSSRLAAGTALALDTAALDVSTDRSGIETKWSDQHGDLFSKNQIVCRMEGRFGLDVYLPTGIAKVTLPSAA
ncbi:phage major capsid protein [Cellulosimicrobium sp. I38E]|uniref:phage major capsid protein n=1 Tax=Cellulosimicrobium sp. I38E TaxID=1393139 RepID=UPI0007B2699F|nr:phage major capsid protein [Cellulosimicrobium sp. I38E]KZM78080.1 hypothetical protein A0J59_02690 [Cellulosimicrobium sp. I38E]